MALVGANAQSQTGSALHPLFADVIAEGKRFYSAHGYVPANHCYMQAVDLSHTARARITASALWATKGLAGENERW